MSRDGVLVAMDAGPEILRAMMVRDQAHDAMLPRQDADLGVFTLLL